MYIFDFIRNKFKFLTSKKNKSINNQSFSSGFTPSFDLENLDNNFNDNSLSLSDDFYLNYYDEIEKYENKFNKSNFKIYEINDIDLRIKQYEKTIKLLNDFKNYCLSKGKGGQKYFEDMWEHCHNSKNPNFKFIDKLYSELNDLKNNKEFYIKQSREHEEINAFKKTVDNELINLISQNQGILQKDIYKYFEPHFKDSIQSSLYFMAKNKKITREKFKNTYKLYTL